MIVSGLILFTVLLACLVYATLRYCQLLKNVGNIPSTKSWHIIGDVPRFMGDTEVFFKTVMDVTEKFRHHGMMVLWMGVLPVVLLFQAEHIQVIMSSSKHIDKNEFYKYTYPWLGQGLLTSTGSKWYKSRKMLTPSFHYNILNDFLLVFQEQASILCKKLDQKVDKGEFNIAPDITHCALDIICETAMGTKLNTQENSNSEYVKSLCMIADIIVQRQKSPWMWPDFLFNIQKCGRDFKKCLDVLHGFCNKVIKERQEEYLKNMNESKEISAEVDTGEDRKLRQAFLDTLLENWHRGEITTENIREEVDTFMFEGHDTTANGINWTIFFIASYPEVQKKLQEEIDTEFGDADKITAQDLKKLTYLECVLKETQRLYPSVPVIGRTVKENTQIGPYNVKEGSDITIVISALHRDPKYFPDPSKFDPDRFLPENIRDRHPYSFVPFSAGPRNCIGQKFAMMEEKVLLSAILRRYNLETTQTIEELHPVFELVLRPRYGIRVKLTRRGQQS